MAGSIRNEIGELKKKRNAVILAHNYQIPEVQDIADYVGDSLGLARKAAKTDADVIVFCGVMFMAETAKILSPEKKVLIPDPHAGCPLAAMSSVQAVRKLRNENPGVPVVAYVNTDAEVKAIADICCTSSNMEEVVNFLDSGKVIFVPDRNMADYIRKRTGKQVITAAGYCPTHQKIFPEHVAMQKKLHPGAKVLAHPECLPAVISMADAITSTGGMVSYAKESPADEFIIATEKEMAYRLSREIPGKKFYPASGTAVCPNMKKTDLSKVLLALREMRHEVNVPEDVRKKALISIERMLELS